jgi:hypothetical protein
MPERYYNTIGTRTLIIERDEVPDNPLDTFDMLGTMVCWHRYYQLGNKHSYATPDNFYLDMVEKYCTYEDIFKYIQDANLEYAKLETRVSNDGQEIWILTDNMCGEEYTCPVNASEYQLNEFAKNSCLGVLDEPMLYKLMMSIPGFVILPLYLYDHSGISISTGSFGDPWDSGQVGYIYCAPEDIKREYGELTEENLTTAKEVLKSEVELYDQYLRGNVWIAQLFEEENCIDSCCGYFGELDDVVEAIVGDFDNVENLAADLQPWERCPYRNVNDYLESLVPENPAEQFSNSANLLLTACNEIRAQKNGCADCPFVLACEHFLGDKTLAKFMESLTNKAWIQKEDDET